MTTDDNHLHPDTLVALALIRGLRNAIVKGAGPSLMLNATVLLNAVGVVAGEVLAMLPDEARQEFDEIVSENTALWRATNSDPNAEPSILTRMRIQ